MQVSPPADLTLERALVIQKTWDQNAKALWPYLMETGYACATQFRRPPSLASLIAPLPPEMDLGIETITFRLERISWPALAARSGEPRLELVQLLLVMGEGLVVHGPVRLTTE